MAKLPPPPMPPDVELTDFKFMPLEVARLRRSRAWLICRRRPDLGFYMVNLWGVSWHERPAGSLEDDDDVLADAAMCSPEKWPEVRADVMRGWVKCSDGRLYHPVVVEKANESWNSKVAKRWKNECDRLRKENYHREKKKLPPVEMPTKPALVEFRFEAGSEEPEEIPSETGTGSVENRDVAAATPQIPTENPLKGQVRDREGKGQGQGQYESSSSVAKATGGKPPKVDDPAKKEVFSTWLVWLLEKTGGDDGGCRSQLGKLRKAFRYDDLALIAAFDRAREADIEDPMPWMIEAAKVHKRISDPDALPQSVQEALEQLKADPNWHGMVHG